MTPDEHAEFERGMKRALARIIAECRKADHHALPLGLNSVVPVEKIREALDMELPEWAELEVTL